MSRVRIVLFCAAALVLATVACAGPAVPLPATSPTDQAVAAATATTAPPPTATFHPIDYDQLKPKLDAAVSAYVKTAKSGACSMAVEYPNAATGKLQTQFSNYGKLSKASKTPVDSSTEYEIGSITKVFTADLLALFVQSNMMNLNDPLQKYLGTDVHVPTFDGKEITLSELATHTSGLPRTPAGQGLTAKMVNGVLTDGYISEEDMLNDLSAIQLDRAPGAK